MKQWLNRQLATGNQQRATGNRQIAYCQLPIVHLHKLNRLSIAYCLLPIAYLITACRTPSASVETPKPASEYSGAATETTAKTDSIAKLDFAVTGPHVLVYKTKADYSNLLPVMLSDDKSKIISYPHPADVKSGNSYRIPGLLNNGYLLDNIGISKNTAYLKLTYEEYANREQPLSLNEMYNLIIDKDPLTELCDCGDKKVFTDKTKQLNELIDANLLKSKCKTLMPIVK